MTIMCIYAIHKEKIASPLSMILVVLFKASKKHIQRNQADTQNDVLGIFVKSKRLYLMQTIST